jgi:hypothetical protein
MKIKYATAKGVAMTILSGFFALIFIIGNLPGPPEPDLAQPADAPQSEPGSTAPAAPVRSSGGNNARNTSTYKKGTVTEAEFRSEFLDLSFRTPAGYVMGTNDELDELTVFEGEAVYVDVNRSILDYEKAHTVHEMRLTDSDSTHRVSVMVEKLGQHNITEEEYLEDIKRQLSASDQSYKFASFMDATIAGRSYTMLTTNTEEHLMYWHVRRVDDRMLVIIVSSILETDAITKAIGLVSEFQSYSGQGGAHQAPGRTVGRNVVANLSILAVPAAIGNSGWVVDWNALKPALESVYPYVTVEIEVLGDVVFASDWLEARILAGDAADMFYMLTSSANKLIGETSSPLEDLSGMTFVSRLTPEELEAASFYGNVYLMPVSNFTGGYAINRNSPNAALLKQIFDELLEAGSELQDAFLTHYSGNIPFAPAR